MSGFKTVLTVEEEKANLEDLKAESAEYFYLHTDEFKRRCYEIWQAHVFEKWGV